MVTPPSDPRSSGGTSRLKTVAGIMSGRQARETVEQLLARPAQREQGQAADPRRESGRDHALPSQPSSTPVSNDALLARWDDDLAQLPWRTRLQAQPSVRP